MSYTKTTWQTGDTITAEKLNNIEGGIKANETAISQIDAGGGDFIIAVTESGGSYTADKTIAEINAAKESGKNLVLIEPFEDGIETGATVCSLASWANVQAMGINFYIFSSVLTDQTITFYIDTAGNVTKSTRILSAQAGTS